MTTENRLQRVNMFWVFIGVALSFVCSDLVYAEIRQCGDGPTPIVDERVTPRHQTIASYGSVLEYAVSDSTNEVFYRTDTKELYRTNISSGVSTKIADAPHALSRVMDRKGMYLVAEPDGYFWELGKSTAWQQMTLSSIPVTSLYWEGDTLYNVREETSSGNPAFQFMRYKAGDSYSNRLCGHVPAHGWGYEMATGHAFPYVYFYKVNSAMGGNYLTLYRFDVRSCLMHTVKSYQYPIPGNIKWVHWYQGSNSLAVATDHPTKNLLYDQGNGLCRYFDLGGEEPIITNPRIPTIAVIRASNTVDLIALQTGKKNEITSPTNYYSTIRWSDFYLMSDSKTLFIAPEANLNRSLVQIRVKP